MPGHRATSSVRITGGNWGV
uniref:Uncharacterized protein n=1 Tax=Anguilla anguilla TaxID=7936 RepID=A0A0E9S559_ANGAN